MGLNWELKMNDGLIKGFIMNGGLIKRAWITCYTYVIDIHMKCIYIRCTYILPCLFLKKPEKNFSIVVKF